MKDPTPIAVTSRSFSRHPVLRSELLNLYENVTFNSTGQALADQDLIEFLRGHVKAITALEVIDEALLAALPELRLISKVGVGLDMIDMKAVERHGVKLNRVAGTNKRSVAELVLAVAISLLRHIITANLEVRSGGWKQHKGGCLSGRTVGVIGIGHVGKEFIRLLKPFGCKLLANDRREFPEFYAEHEVISVGLEELLRQSDVVTIHVPLDSSTRKILDAQRLALLKPGAILINTARGNLVDEIEVKSMLTSGKLAGAAFDVFTTEPPTDTELLNLSNFIATPHIGGSTEEAILEMGRAAIAGLETTAS